MKKSYLQMKTSLICLVKMVKRVLDREMKINFRYSKTWEGILRFRGVLHRGAGVLVSFDSNINTEPYQHLAP